MCQPAQRARAGELDLIHVEFAYLGSLLQRAAPELPWVLAEQETMSLASERLGPLPWRAKTPYQHLLQREQARVRRFEARMLPRFARVYGITRVEALSKSVEKEEFAGLCGMRYEAE